MVFLAMGPPKVLSPCSKQTLTWCTLVYWSLNFLSPSLLLFLASGSLLFSQSWSISPFLFPNPFPLSQLFVHSPTDPPSLSPFLPLSLSLTLIRRGGAGGEKEKGKSKSLLPLLLPCWHHRFFRPLLFPVEHFVSDKHHIILYPTSFHHSIDIHFPKNISLYSFTAGYLSQKLNSHI